MLQKLKQRLRLVKRLKNPTTVVRFTKGGKKMVLITEFSPFFVAHSLGAFEVFREYKCTKDGLVEVDADYPEKD